MRNHHRFIILPIFILFSLTVYKAYAYDQQTLSMVLQGDPRAVASLQQAIRHNPKITVPETRTEYSIKIIEPKPDIDYKIVEITPDPTINYDIIIIPDAGKRSDSLNRWLGPELRKILPKRLKK